jgi:crotonobetainyl-CoA:carnitine CoA-transferase CaiB-like acyl-CoA transferase
LTEQAKEETVLGGLRVIDLADEKGLYCTKLLADLGADVIKVERPGGDATRQIGPFWHDEPGPEKSLYFAYLNNSKRGVTLDLEHPDGQQIFMKLIREADILVETFDPGYLDGLGLCYPDLKKLNPALVMPPSPPSGRLGRIATTKALTSSHAPWAASCTRPARQTGPQPSVRAGRRTTWPPPSLPPPPLPPSTTGV